jgi:hypothetical protein
MGYGGGGFLQRESPFMDSLSTGIFVSHPVKSPVSEAVAIGMQGRSGYLHIRASGKCIIIIGDETSRIGFLLQCILSAGFVGKSK